MKILVGLWVFPDSGWGGGNPASNEYPSRVEVDWIRLYRFNEDQIYPCSPLPTCLPPADRDYSKNNADDGVPPTPGGT